MWLLSAATLLALLKVLAFLEWADVAGIAGLSWWWVIGGFAASAAWFAYADWSGLTNRKAMERIEKRKKERLEKQKALLRTPHKR